ncbi:MAG TPA: ROK family protein [Beutenbergiaceae bacterium]|nr:ROK family protein [Beutenbergiaceae bacterium]
MSTTGPTGEQIPGHDIGFGIDIGGSGIKGAPVNLATGQFLAKRLRLPTPANSTPDAVGAVLAQIVAHFDLPAEAGIGVTFPGVVRHDVIGSSANMDKAWVGTDMAAVVRKHTGHTAHVVNDADAAGYAEGRYGAARGKPGVVMVLTLGTGIGSAIINDGVLVPNTELGHLILAGERQSAEVRASSAAKDREGLDYAQWAQRLQTYLEFVEFLFSPDLFVLGGGISRDYQQFLQLLDTRAPIVPADLRNKAGIIGAAALAAK